MKVGEGNGGRHRKNNLTKAKFTAIFCMPSAWIPKRELFSAE